MNKIVISTNTRYAREKEYILSVIMNDFWGVTYEIRFEETARDYFKFESPESDINLYLPSILFAVEESDWLTSKVHPTPPLRVRQLSDLHCKELYLKEIPVLYGEEQTRSFSDDSEELTFDMDILGSMFFLITLYEEINAPETDEFGRFDYTQSILFKENLTARPIANEYLEILWQLLLKIQPGLVKKSRTYTPVISHDIDSPLANNYPFMNFCKSSGMDLISRRSLSLFLKRAYSRFSRNMAVDPHNTFEFLMDASESIGVKSAFNFIVIDGKGGIDGAYDLTHPFFKTVLDSISSRGHTIGIHPSFYTMDDPEKAAAEFMRFFDICSEHGIHQETWGGRQHYLRWKNPITWRTWNEMGATYDSSIGSEYFMGFRAGLCYSYPVFDLMERKKLALREIPLIVMDVCAFKLGSFAQYREKIVKLVEACKFFNGHFTLLFHNNYVVSPQQKRAYTALLNIIM